MNKTLRNFLFWAPRGFSILFILFLSLFSFDVFEGPDPWWMKAGGFLIHNIPSFVLALGLAFAWKHEWLGALAFCGWGVFYVVAFGANQHWSASVLLGALPFAFGLLWAAGWRWREQIRGG